MSLTSIRNHYWDRVKGDDLPAGLDLCVFDFGVRRFDRAAKYTTEYDWYCCVRRKHRANTLRASEAYVQVEGLAATIDTYQADHTRVL